MRTLIIGDIHGHLDPLKDALNKINYDPTEDRLIFVGDYINGGKQPVEVIDLLLKIKHEATHTPIFILGNHDYWFCELLRLDLPQFHEKKYMLKKHKKWMKKGGEQTYKAYRKIEVDQLVYHKTSFFDQLQYYYKWDNKLVIHAGFDPNIGFEKTLKRESHALFWDRSLFQLAVKKFGKNDRRLNKFGNRRKPLFTFDTVYIGHTPTIKLGFDTPRRIGNIVNVDQGCKYTGKLTVWDDNSQSFIQGMSKS